MTAGAYSLLAVVLYHTGDFNQVYALMFFQVSNVKNLLLFIKHMNYYLLLINTGNWEELVKEKQTTRYSLTTKFIYLKNFKFSTTLITKKRTVGVHFTQPYYLQCPDQFILPSASINDLFMNFLDKS